MKHLNKIFAVSVLAISAVTAANAKIVSETMLNTSLESKVPTTRTVNSKALSADITLDATDVLTSTQQTAVNSGITSTLVGKITTNESAISTLNGSGAGSVAKAIADAIDANNTTKDATTVTHEANTAVGSTTQPVYIDTDGSAKATNTLGSWAWRSDTVKTADIEDANVTKAKLDSTVQASLDKADSALQTHQAIATGTTNGTISVAGTDVAVAGLQSGAYAPAYSLPIATDTTLGGVKEGTNVSINSTTGAISVGTASGSAKGVMQVGSDLAVADGVVSVDKATTVASGNTKPVTSDAVNTALNAKQANLAGTQGQLVITTGVAGSVTYSPAYPTVAPTNPDGEYILTAKKDGDNIVYAWENVGR